ncbi:ATP-binding protein [Marinobacterium litorale]|uniref:ATP-binding protein n=1 Tax=Marinobacterium litorale TaxID=404770 RepID=UPI0003FDF829|nr:ATP-binding protein [Marinobacterium litorale]
MFEVIKTEDRHCEKHDLDWVCEFTKFASRTLESECPKCLEEREAEEERKRQIEFEEERRKAAVAAKRKQLEQRISSSLIPDKYLTRSFDNYRVETDAQGRALETTRRFAEHFDQFQRTGAGLIMIGRPGTGKTHLACAIANALIEKGATVLFVTVSKMIRRIRETYRRDSEYTEQQMIDSLRDVDLLIIDEVGIQRGTESEEHLLFEVLNERNSVFGPTIILSNLTVEEIKAYVGERALDRLREGGGKLVVFDWGSYRGNVADDADLPCADSVVPLRTESRLPHQRPFPMGD